ncbi:MAG: hypothetical protein GY940_01185, partial [bacterium]|nr:hypothetical protein [bacterium]
MKHSKSIALFSFFVLLSSLFFTGVALEASGAANASCVTERGLHILRFTTPHGDITLDFPDDMAIGDLVSGKINLEPLGQKEKKIARNLKALKKYILEVGGQKIPANSQWGKWNIPDIKEFPVTLRNPKGKVIARTQATVLPSIPDPGTWVFSCDDVCLAGDLFRYRGKFDGDFANTDVRIEGKELTKWAESPRQVILSSPRDVVGNTTINLKEEDRLDQCAFRNLSLESQIGKANLLKGEKTNIKIIVSGLEGLNKSIPFNIVNKTPAIVTMIPEGPIAITPGTVQPGGFFTFESLLTGVTPGNFLISATVVKKEDCEKIRIIYNALKAHYDKRAKDCRKLAREVEALKRKKADAEAEKKKAEKDLDQTRKDIKVAQKKLDAAKKKLEDLVNFAIHHGEISTDPGSGFVNSIGLGGGQVRVYFSGSDNSVNTISWFLNNYRDKWTKLDKACRKARNNLNGLKNKQRKAEKNIEKAKNKLEKIDEDLKAAEKRLKECLKGLKPLDQGLKQLWEDYKHCLKRLEEQRQCVNTLDDVDSGIDDAGAAIQEAEEKINGAEQAGKGLKNPCPEADNKSKEAKELLQEAKDLARKAQELNDKAREAYQAGDLEKANKLAKEANALSEEAKKKTQEAKDKAGEIETEVEKCKEKEKQIEQAEKEEKEWWDEFLNQDDPTPHDITGGEKALAIGLRNLLDEHIEGLISTPRFNIKSCKAKCLIAVRNTYGKQFSELVKGLAWGVFWGSIQLPALVTSTAVRVSFAVFKVAVSKLVTSNMVIPLWGSYTYKHPYGSFKGMSIDNFECQLESTLCYNKETGYVTGMVFCNCCGTVTTL